MFSRKSSFRRILLTRLLLVSLPILLIGVYVTYRKARSAFLDTARQNLTESANIKANNIKQSIQYLRSTLFAASYSYIFKDDSASPQAYQDFIGELTKNLSGDIHCLQINQIKDNKKMASNCQDNIKLSPIILKKEQQNTSFNKIYIKTISLPSYGNQLYLHLYTTIYDRKQKPKYILSLIASIGESKNSKVSYLSGYSAIINEKGVIIAYPRTEQVENTTYEGDYEERLTILLKKALQGKKNFIHVFSSESDQKELIARYSFIASPITGEEREKWVIIAVSPMYKVIEPLKEIQVTLFYMVFTLTLASVLAMLYIAYELARPIEQIRDYALNKENLNSQEELPKNIKIQEFHQLASAIEQMLERLQKWGTEITSAWQEAKKANEVKNEFLTTISHELRTPLNGIINSLRIVKDGYCEDEQEEKEFLQQADIGAIHLFKIINDLLDIGKIEAGKMNVNIESVDLEKIITEVIKMQKAVIQQKGLCLKEPKWTEKIIVQADPGKFKQVMINLLHNAIKFTDRGDINVEIKLQKLANSESQEVLITVQDTGIGIDNRDQSKLFRPFVMVDGTTTRKFGGTGLGLAICYNLMHLMGGGITLYSAGLGKGTTLCVTLPVISLMPLLPNC